MNVCVYILLILIDLSRHYKIRSRLMWIEIFAFRSIWRRWTQHSSEMIVSASVKSWNCLGESKQVQDEAQ